MQPWNKEVGYATDCDSRRYGVRRDHVAGVTPSRPTGHQTVAFSEGQQTPLSEEEFLQKVERHMERQDRPGTTLRFR